MPSINVAYFVVALVFWERKRYFLAAGRSSCLMDSRVNSDIFSPLWDPGRFNYISSLAQRGMMLLLLLLLFDFAVAAGDCCCFVEVTTTAVVSC